MDYQRNKQSKTFSRTIITLSLVATLLVSITGCPQDPMSFESTAQKEMLLALGDIKVIENEINQKLNNDIDYRQAYFWSLVGQQLGSSFAKESRLDLEKKLGDIREVIDIQAAARSWKPSTKEELLINSIFDENIDMIQALLECPDKESESESESEKVKCSIPAIPPDEKGWTPLLYAVSTGNLELTKIIYEKYGGLEIEASDGTTPLILASYLGYSGLVKYFLEHQSPDIENMFFIQNRLGMDAYQAAISSKQNIVIGLLEAPRRRFYKWLQSKLWEYGFYDGRFDGIPGENTNKAIALFRDHRKLKDSGLIDNELVVDLTSAEEPIWKGFFTYKLVWSDTKLTAAIVGSREYVRTYWERYCEFLSEETYFHDSQEKQYCEYLGEEKAKCYAATSFGVLSGMSVDEVVKNFAVAIKKWVVTKDIDWTEENNATSLKEIRGEVICSNQTMASPFSNPLDANRNSDGSEQIFIKQNDIVEHPNGIKGVTSQEYKHTRPDIPSRFSAIGTVSLIENEKVEYAGTATLADFGDGGRDFVLIPASALLKGGKLRNYIYNFKIYFNVDPMGNNVLPKGLPMPFYRRSIDHRHVWCATRFPEKEPQLDLCRVRLQDDLPQSVQPIFLNFDKNIKKDDRLVLVGYSKDYGFGRVRLVSDNCNFFDENTILKTHNCDCGDRCSGAIILDEEGNGIGLHHGGISKSIKGMKHPNYLGSGISFYELSKNSNFGNMFPIKIE